MPLIPDPGGRGSQISSLVYIVSSRPAKGYIVMPCLRTKQNKTKMKVKTKKAIVLYSLLLEKCETKKLEGF